MRLQTLADARPGLFARFVYFVARRKLGKVPVTIKLLGGANALLAGLGAFETAQERSHRVPARIKALAQIRTAQRIGCPF